MTEKILMEIIVNFEFISMYYELEQMEQAIHDGGAIYACWNLALDEWEISADWEVLLARAQLAGEKAHVYRLVSPDEAGDGDSFLFVRRMQEPDSRMPFLLRWALADTREAAELLRDVSAGPTPYFAVTVDTSCRPASADQGLPSVKR